jgi:putative dehydrogenase
MLGHGYTSRYQTFDNQPVPNIMSLNPEHSSRGAMTTDSSRPAIGVIGLGIMGSLYARHLLGAAFTVTGYDVSAERLQSFREAGGHVAESAAEVVERSDVVLTALSSITAFRSVLLDPDGASARARAGQIFIETGTIPIDLKTQARGHLQQHGAKMIDAPVTGTRVHAERKDLVVYGSGDEADFVAARPIIEAFARNVRFVGSFGAGMKLKIVTNLLVAVHNVAAAEALALAKTAGLDLRLVYDLINGGAAGSVAFGFRGLLMVEGRFNEPTMRMDVFSKDLDIIDDFASTLHAATPLFQSSVLVYRNALAQGMKTEDVSAVFEILSAASGNLPPAVQPSLSKALI